MASQLQIVELEDEMQMHKIYSEEEKVELFLQKLQRHMLAAHKYQVEKLIHEVLKYWPDLSEAGRIQELVR